MSPKATVFIPVYNAGPRLHAVIEAVRRQRAVATPELIATDSSSTDGSRQVLEEHGVPHVVIPQAEFGHGRTRNAAARRADSKIVVFLSQDAVPLGDDWLAELLRPFDDSTVVGSWSRQVPRPACHPFRLIDMERHGASGALPAVRGPCDRTTWDAMAPVDRLALIAFDNVASAVRRDTLLKRPFPDVAFAEDLAWARDVILSGRRIAYCPAARVEHSHDINRWEIDGRVRLAHREIRRLTDFTPLPDAYWLVRRTLGQALRFATAGAISGEHGALDRLRFVLAALPCACRQMLARYVGGRAARYAPPEFE